MLGEDIKIPNHIAIIMDGNRRWARKNHLPQNMGHKKGADTLEEIAKYADEIGVEILTVFAFSTENWNRTKEEVDYLMELLANSIIDFDKRFNNRNARVRMIGDIHGIPEKLRNGILDITERTKNNTGITVNVAINYGGRAEIINAVKQIAEDYKDSKITSLDSIDEKLVSSYMYTGLDADPDLIIRTAGECRLSGFLTWQSVYSELYFTDVTWPDFDNKELDKAIIEYNNRKRNFGK